MQLEQKIKEFADKRNLMVGIATPEPFEELRPRLQKTKKQLESFVEKDMEKRIDPRKTMPNVQSIIVLAMPYQKNVKDRLEGLRGYFSVGAVGLDYHEILKQHLQQLSAFLQEEIPEMQCQFFVDTGPLVDRSVAVRAGIGRIGDNGCVHTEKFGSMVFLGYLLTDHILCLDSSAAAVCTHCGKCIAACPNGALQKNGFAMEKCISYLTQTKGILSRENMKRIGKQLYGCDICQIVCPNNARYQPATTVPAEEAMPLLRHILTMSNREFRETIGKTAAGWRGKKIIQRNAVIVLGNCHSEESLPLLAQALTDKRPLIRQTAVRSILNLEHPKGIFLLQQAKKTEQEPEILQEIQEGIEILQYQKGEKHGILEFERSAGERAGRHD